MPMHKSALIELLHLGYQLARHSYRVAYNNARSTRKVILQRHLHERTGQQKLIIGWN
jgi:hypothetical protein